MGRDILIFALLVMLFGGFGQVSESGLYVVVFALFVGLMGFWQAAREAVRE